MAWCRKAGKAKAAVSLGVTKTASFLRRSLAVLCKVVVVVHACLALLAVAAASLVNHPLIGRWVPATERHITTLAYCRTHTIFPWTAVLLLRCTFQIFKVCLCSVVLCAKFPCGRPGRPSSAAAPTASDGRAPGPPTSEPSAPPPMCQPRKPLRQPAKPQRKRMYPNTPGYARAK